MENIGISIPEHVLWQRTGDAMVLLDSVNGQYFELNETAQGAFSVLTQTQDFSAAVLALTQEFDVSEARAISDLTKLIEELATAGLISLTRSA